MHTHKMKYLHLNITKSQGLLLGLHFSSCTSMLLKQMPRALQQAHGVGETQNQMQAPSPEKAASRQVSPEQTAAAWELIDKARSWGQALR